MYTREQFGNELKEKLAEENEIAAIGSWAYDVYLGDVDPKDAEFLNILLILNTMEDGPEFELSPKRLNEIADDLINGKTNINMDY